MKYAMTCSCGHEMSVDAASKEKAVSMMKDTMNEEAVAKHFADMHPGEEILSVSQVHAMIEQNLAEA